MNQFLATTYYLFTPISADTLEEVRTQFLNKGSELGIRGLMLIAAEGINATIAGTPESISVFKKILTDTFGPITFKDSPSDHQPFKRWKVSIREEIVALGKPDIVPNGKNNHLSPQDWDKMLREEDTVVIDVRNKYETKIGTFKGAIDPKTETFNEFPEFVKNSGIAKDKKVLICCTGGIRCEKAIVEMQQQGYEHVYQLDGGILKYIEEMPNQSFEGECFIFDHRVAVDQNLQPTKRYVMCLHCGNPGERKVTCVRCAKPGRACQECLDAGKPEVCSKDCAHHLALQRA